MSTLPMLIARASGHQRLKIAGYLGLFPPDHRLRDHLPDERDLQAAMHAVKSCATAEGALRQLRSETLDDVEPWQLAVVDVIRDEVEPPKCEMTSVASTRLARIRARTQAATPRGRPIRGARRDRSGGY